MRVSKKFVTLLALAASALVFSCSLSFLEPSGKDPKPGAGSVTDEPADSGGAESTTPWRDPAIVPGGWADVADLGANLAYGEWDGTVGVALDGTVAKMTVLAKADTAGWSGGTLAQVPPGTSSGSRFDFSAVKTVHFRIKSATLGPGDVKFILQDGSGNLINGVPLSSYGIASIVDWTDVDVDVSSYSSKAIKTAAAFFLGTGAGKSAEFTDIAFLDSEGKNAAIAAGVSWPVPEYSPKDSLSLVWSDEFDGASTTPDANTWGYDTVDVVGGGWGNGESQTYTDSRDNSWVDGGTLKIRALKDGTGAWTSGRLVSKNKMDFTYGYLEFRAKIAVGAGTWPALWMLPTDNEYGGWPASGEIDVMEHATSTTGLGNVYGTVHRQAGSGGAGASAGTKVISSAGTEFHSYAVYWTEDSLAWYYDDVKLGEYLRSGGTGWEWWPFDKDFHAIMNIAIGGNLGGAIDPDLASDVMEVDWVRLYR